MDEVQIDVISQKRCKFYFLVSRDKGGWTKQEKNWYFCDSVTEKMLKNNNIPWKRLGAIITLY